jgi:hypothetical protein
LRQGIEDGGSQASKVKSQQAGSQFFSKASRESDDMMKKVGLLAIKQ